MNEDTEELTLVRGFCIPLDPQERHEYVEARKAEQEEAETVAATSLSIHIGTDLKSAIQATQRSRPELTFEQSWNLLRRQRPELFKVTAAGYERTKPIEPVPAGKPSGNLLARVQAHMRETGLAFTDAFNDLVKV
jgi:hypothetical protein